MKEIFQGTITGTGSEIKVCLGFKPTFIRFYKETSIGMLVAEWSTLLNGLIKFSPQAVNEGGTDTYNIGFSTKVADVISQYDGDDETDGSNAYQDGNGNALPSGIRTSYGFTLGADSDLNIAGETVWFVAYR